LGEVAVGEKLSLQLSLPDRSLPERLERPLSEGTDGSLRRIFGLPTGEPGGLGEISSKGATFKESSFGILFFAVFLLLTGVLTEKSSGSSKTKFTVVTGVRVLDLQDALGGVRFDKIMLSADGFLIGVPVFLVSLCFSVELVTFRAPLASDVWV